MAELQAIKRRLRSVSNTRQITKAMQLVAASKLRRAQMAALAPQPYLAAIRDMLSRLGSSVDAAQSPLYQRREAINALAIVVTADRGLAGAYNNNIFRELSKLQRQTGGELAIITVGKRGSLHLSRITGIDEIAAYEMDSRDADAGLARPILAEAKELFLSGKCDVVHLISTRFVSSSVQTVDSRQLLPVASSDSSSTAASPEAEPNPETVLATATERLLEAEVYLSIVEARASEQAARMLAMMNASDNASDIIDDLTLARNNARQSAITQELAEISGGAEAVSNN
ncbi:ATP synthase F1 subunit gamma [Candidatus Saccharibacteria bacterium]|nr:ATP synthase F1 subunit gamma [Candidatus Saccharibacteria bacterium]